MKCIAIIPARYASTRFPGKPLAKIGEKTVIQRVYEQVNKEIAHVFVATDDQRIMEHVESWGGNAVMTSSEHQSGTDRIEEAMERIESEGGNFDVVVNVQGDEPFISPEQISSLCGCFADEKTQIATLGIRFADDIAGINSANSPKIVTDNDGFAMYFSRSVIPYCRGVEQDKLCDAFPYMKHIGMYAYRREVLREITRLPQSALEIAEKLEQLRWLQNGYRIKVAETSIPTIGIDTPEDLEKAIRYAQLNTL